MGPLTNSDCKRHLKPPAPVCPRLSTHRCHLQILGTDRTATTLYSNSTLKPIAAIFSIPLYLSGTQTSKPLIQWGMDRALGITVNKQGAEDTLKVRISYALYLSLSLSSLARKIQGFQIDLQCSGCFLPACPVRPVQSVKQPWLACL